MSKRLLFVAFFAVASGAVGCGRASDEDGGAAVDAPAVKGSAHHGMAFAAVSTDQSVRASRIYYYDFEGAKIRELLPAESGNPALFTVEGKIALFNRQSDQKSVRVFDPKAAGPLPDAVTVESLEDGDPFDAVSLVEGRSLLLASPLARKLQTLDYTTGTLADVEPGAPLASGELRPRALWRDGSKVHVLHSGLRFSPQISVDATQQIYVADVGDGGSVTLKDQKTATPTVLDGVPVRASNASAFLDADGGTALVVGLCDPASMPGCVAAADRYGTGGASVQPVNAFPDSEFKYYFVNQIVDGPTATSVYAHVRTPDGQYKIVHLDTSTGAVSDVHLFSSSRLFGIAYDRTSKMLFVGDQAGLKGSLTLYADDTKIATVELDGVPYVSAFAPK